MAERSARAAALAARKTPPALILAVAVLCLLAALAIPSIAGRGVQMAQPERVGP